MAFEIYRAVGCDEWEAFELLIGEKLVGHEVPIHIFPVIKHRAELVGHLVSNSLSLSESLDWVLDV